MKQFDYETAWKELAEPGFNALPQNVRDLYERVCVESANLGQNNNLDMVWPQTDLRERFEEIPAEELARASLIVYTYGHWSPQEHSHEGRGGTWKFSHYADQVLRERLGLALVPYPQRRGLSYRVTQGMLVVDYWSRDTTVGYDVALATPTTLDFTRETLAPHVALLPALTRKMEHQWLDELLPLIDTLRDALWPALGLVAGFRPGFVAKYMVDADVLDERRKQVKMAAQGKAIAAGTCAKCKNTGIVEVRDIRETWEAGALQQREVRDTWWECPGCGYKMWS